MAVNNPESSFNPHDHIIQIRSGQTSKDYLPVAWRLVWFRLVCPQGMIETDLLHLDLDREVQAESQVWDGDTRKYEKVVKCAQGFALFRAVVKDGLGGVSTGTKSENAASFGDFIEKAETGAIGRALAALGYGTQFTAGEFEEGERLADAPVERNGKKSSPAHDPNKITLVQKSSIKNLSGLLGRAISDSLDDMSNEDAKSLILSLAKEYNELKNLQKDKK